MVHNREAGRVHGIKMKNSWMDSLKQHRPNSWSYLDEIIQELSLPISDALINLKEDHTSEIYDSHPLGDLFKARTWELTWLLPKTEDSVRQVIQIIIRPKDYKHLGMRIYALPPYDLIDLAADSDSLDIFLGNLNKDKPEESDFHHIIHTTYPYTSYASLCKFINELKNHTQKYQGKHDNED